MRWQRRRLTLWPPTALPDSAEAMPSYSRIYQKDGSTVFVCGRSYAPPEIPKPCNFPGCSKDSPLVCDYPFPAPTCNEAMCRDHSLPVALGIDYCQAGKHLAP